MLYLSRVSLKRNASVEALVPLLLGNTARGGCTSGHHLVWSLFADSPDRLRDFLWREIDTGVFIILSTRLPIDRHQLFEIAEPKPFTPTLRPGDRLQFSLRANPVVRRRQLTRRRSVKHDVVMDILRSGPQGERAGTRHAVMYEQGFAWLERQGGKSGFKVRSEELSIDGYVQHRISRKRPAPSMSFSTLDFEGILTVTDSTVFLPAISRGFGAAKAYGCGLMLIRRA